MRVGKVARRGPIRFGSGRASHSVGVGLQPRRWNGSVRTRALSFFKNFMDPICRNPVCGVRHDPLWNCSDPRIVREVVVHNEPAAVVHRKTGEDRYKDADARKAYRRRWMAERRAK